MTIKWLEKLEFFAVLSTELICIQFCFLVPVISMFLDFI